MKIIQINTEDEIVQKALDVLGKHVQIGKEIQIESLSPSNQFPPRPNRLLKVMINNQLFEFCIEIRTILTRAHLMMLQFIKHDLEYPPLVIGKYVNPQIADKLVELGIGFIDTAGNAFINRPPLYVFIRGHKAAEVGQQKQMPPAIRTFKPTGLKIIYALLCHPGLEKKTYREIAAVSGVALGTVNWIMRELKELGYLLNNSPKGQRLIQKAVLLQRWTTIYPDQLRPKYVMGRYHAEQGWSRKTKLNPAEAQWGGEVAAAKLMHDAAPQQITIYATPQGISNLLSENGLHEDEGGNVEILRRFWGSGPIWPDEHIVPPILIYSDLLATGNREAMELAKEIYEKHLVPLIGES